MHKNNLPTINLITSQPVESGKKRVCHIEYTTNHDHFTIKSKARKRGGVSIGYKKQSFSIELNQKLPLCNLPTDDDWILNANYIDKTFMRHKISYDLYRSMNAKNIAPRCAYVEVQLNDEYNGLYLLMEKMDASTLELDKSDTLAMIFKDPPLFYEQILPHVQHLENPYQQNYPNITQSDKTYFIEAFKTFLFHSSDSAFAQTISAKIDIDNVIDWHLLLLFSNNSDGIMKNFYLYKKDAYTPFRIAIWDYDHSFGRDGDNELNMMRQELDCSRSILLKRLMEVKETRYVHELKKRWFYLRTKKIISVQTMQHLIDKNHNIIKGQLDSNFQKWPVDGPRYYDSNSYLEELEIMMKFVKLRINQLDKYMDGLSLLE